MGHNNPVPESATLLLFGSGLIGLAVIGRRGFSKKSSRIEGMEAAIKHYMNPLHIYCRPRDFDLAKRPARFLCRMYEHAIFRKYFLVRDWVLQAPQNQWLIAGVRAMMQESVERRSEKEAITMPMETKSIVFRGSPKWISERVEEICEEVAFRNGEITQMTQSSIKESIVLCIIYKIPLRSSRHSIE